MKVYVVTYTVGISYEGDVVAIRGVFSSRTKAEEYINTNAHEVTSTEIEWAFFEIEELELA